MFMISLAIQAASNEDVEMCQANLLLLVMLRGSLQWLNSQFNYGSLVYFGLTCLPIFVNMLLNICLEMFFFKVYWLKILDIHNLVGKCPHSPGLENRV